MYMNVNWDMLFVSYEDYVFYLLNMRIIVVLCVYLSSIDVDMYDRMDVWC